jgi:transposase
MQRRRFTPEFKREAVKLARQPGAVTAKIAEELGLNANVLRRWIQQFEQGRWESKPGVPLKTEQQAEIERLRKENAKLRTERDILKKAAAYFAKEPQ